MKKGTALSKKRTLSCRKCKHKWNYKGFSKFYATCPHCYNKVRISKLKRIAFIGKLPK